MSSLQSLDAQSKKAGGGTSTTAAASSSGGGGGVWGQNPASSTPCDIPGQPCSPVGSLGGTSQWCKCVSSGGGGGAAPSSGGTGGGSGFSFSSISGSLTSLTSRVKPYDTYMIIGGAAMFVIPMFVKKGMKQLQMPGIALLIFGLYLKYGSQFGLPGA